jgi:lipopolysaccharide export LptBFGC system permease protein LptF
VFSAQFPLLLDDYVLKDFVVYLAMIVGTFLMLLLVFTFFELLKDLGRVPITVIGQYLLTVTPYFLYNSTPMSMLLAVLITFGLLEKTNEITAMKATGVSIYRIIIPVLVVAAMVSAGLFFFDQFYLPQLNKKQDALRNEIKGKPPQTYLRPDQKWIFGQNSSIWYYEFFDPDQNRFGGISVFEFNPKTFELKKRIYASRAHWSDTLNKWIFEHIRWNDCRGLSHLRCRHLRRTAGASELFQEGSEAVVGDELRRASPLHQRLETKWLRRGAPACATAKEICLPADDVRHGSPRRSICPEWR